MEISDYKISPLSENSKDTNIDKNNKKRTLLMEKIINNMNIIQYGPHLFDGSKM